LVQQDIIIDNYDTVPDKNTVLKNCKTEIWFWSNVKVEDKLIKQLDKDEFWNYVNIKNSNKDKIVVTQKENDDAKECVWIYYWITNTLQYFLFNKCLWEPLIILSLNIIIKDLIFVE
jgi:hypothetical protein